MGSEWQAVRFSQLCDITRGASPRPINDWFTDSGIPWVKISDANSAQSRYITVTGQYIKPEGRHKSVEVKPGDLILSNSATPGIPKFMGIYACIHDGWLLLRKLRNLDKYFAYYLLLHERPKLVAQGNGSVFTNLKTEILKNHLVKLPPLPEQRAIAHILGTLDDKIELNRKRNETLEAMARALFKDWFVDFGPVRAKLEGRDPYLPAEIWDLFPDRLDDDGKPEGWGYLPFDELLQGTIGGDWGKENAEDDHEHPVCIIRGTDIPDLASGFTGKVPTRYTTKKKLESRILIAGDIIVEVSGGSPTQPTGRSLQVTQSMIDRFKHPVVCASFCRRFRPVNRELGLMASSHLANLYRNGGTWEYQNQSTGISNFQTSHFLKAENVMLPSQGVLNAFVRFVETILAIKTDNENITLTRLRDTLLPKLISGVVRVRDVDRFIDRAIR
jgi:type I restriction enzyme S subunit